MAKGKEIFNSGGSKVALKGTSGNDTITNEIYGDSGGDAILSKNVTIYGGKGNDLITNDGSDSRGYDTRGANTKIYGEAGNDTINNIHGNRSTIDGGAGNDSISNSGDKVKIYGGAGNDSIYSDSPYDGIAEGSGVTIAGGTGNDYIELNGENNTIQYAEGDGNDTIVGFYDDDTLQITSGTPLITKSGNNLVVKVGESSILLKDALFYGYEKIHFQDSFGNPITYNDWKVWNGSIENNLNGDVTLAGSSKDDTIGNSGKSVYIDGGNGNDSITNSGDHATISGGAGNDTITSYFYTDDNGYNIYVKNVTIDGGAGDDYISLGSYNENHLIRYAKGDGNDTVVGFNDDDTLQITSGKYKVDTTGSDFIVTVGKNTVVFKLENGLEKINIADSSGNVKTYDKGDWTVWNGSIPNNKKDSVTLAGSSEDDTIGNSGKNVLITGKEGNDSISNWSSNVTVDGGEGNDSIKNSGDFATISGGAGNDSITNSGDYATIIGGAGDDYISLGGYWWSWVKNTLIQYAEGDGNDTIVGFNDDDTLQITSGSYTVDTVSTVGNDLVVTVGKNTVVFKRANGLEKINIADSLGNVTTYDWTVWNGSISNNEKDSVTLAGSSEDDTIGNSGKNVLITGKEGNDSISNLSSNVTISGGAGNDIIANSGGSKVTISGDAGNDIIYNRGYNISIVGGAGNDSIRNAGGTGSTVDGGAGNDTILSSGSKVTITGGKGSDYISVRGGFGGGSTVDGGAGNDTILSDGSKMTITGGTGSDYISVRGGAKNNIIQYASGDGKDTVVGFDANDTLKITSGTYSAKASGSDVIVTVGKGSIRLKDAAKKKISIADASGNVTTKKYSSKTSALFAENNFVTADNLSSIVENNLSSVSEIQTQNFDSLTQKNNLIAYANK